MIDNEIIQSDIDEGKRRADKYLKEKGFSNEQIAHIRIKAKSDLFFLCFSLLGYDKLSKGLHGDVCAWSDATVGEKYRLFLLARSHYKTTVQTIGDTIQIVLPDDAKTAVYPRNLGTDGRILLCHEKHESASRFLFSITQHFTINPVLTAFFPECVPNVRRHKINKNELELPRESIWSEPTIDTMGVGGKNQGRHYNQIKADDIYGAEARDSKAERDSTILWFDNLQSYFITPKTDHLDISGTRWAHDDIYQHAMNVYGKRLKRFIRPAIDKVTGEPVFPEQFSLEDFEILKRNPIVWNAQYANDPYEGASSFKKEWLRFFEWSGRGSRDITLHNGLEEKNVRYESLDRILFVDPAVTGLSGLCLTGTTEQHEIVVLEAEKKNYRTEELLDRIFQLVVRYRPRIVAIEEVVFSALYDPIFRREMNTRGIRFRLEMVKIGKAQKAMRVNGLANFFSAGQIYFHPAQNNIITEFCQFGATDDYHILDAMSMGQKLWRAGVNQRLIDKYKEAEDEIRGIDPITGYSSIRRRTA